MRDGARTASFGARTGALAFAFAAGRGVGFAVGTGVGVGFDVTSGRAGRSGLDRGSNDRSAAWKSTIGRAGVRPGVAEREASPDDDAGAPRDVIEAEPADGMTTGLNASGATRVGCEGGRAVDAETKANVAKAKQRINAATSRPLRV